MLDPLIAPERLSDLIGLIYDCAIDNSRWPIAMEAIRTALRCHNATLDLVELPSGTLLTSATTNIPPAYLPLLAQAGPDAVAQWGGEEIMRTLPLDRPAVMSHVNPTFETLALTNHYYQAFAQPQGLVDVIAVPLARDARAVGALAFGRHTSAGPIGEYEIAIAQLLLPHLQRAATINRLIEKEASASATMVSTLDVLSVPIVLIDGARRVVHANPASRRLLSAGDVIRLSAGTLETAIPAASSTLAAFVASIQRRDNEVTPRPLDMPITLSDGTIRALHVMPLIGKGGSSEAPRSTKTAVAALFVSAPPAGSSAGVHIVASLFNLTGREADVFAYLAMGLSQSKTAAALDISISTVKTHLRRLYEKIGVNSHAELVAVAASLPILTV